MITENSTANAVGGRTARACDSCLWRRARWYCSADDAFLCQGCDVSVHSANQLARRHERVRLHTASFKVVVDEPATNDDCTPAWHHGFTRKARTPRNAKSRQSKSVPTLSTCDHVPEMGSEFDFDNSIEQNEEQLVCRVPVFEPFEDELCAGNNNIMIGDDVMVNDDAANNNIVLDNGDAACTDELDVEGFLPSEVDLAEFGADVESLLEKEANDVVVKIEDDIDDEAVAMQSPSPLELTFDVEEKKVIDWGLDRIDTEVVSVVEEKVEVEGMVPSMVEEINKDIEVGNGKCEEVKNKKRKMLLRLNYEAVMADWVSHTSRSPWTTGCRREFDLDDEWFNCTVSCSSGNIQNQAWGDHMAKGSMRAEGIGDDKGREARVSRYREKRRTRMFSKKIRYQVRKLNAEKRPRMKGRFVKRTSLFNDQGRPSLP